jgi:hypothetical protein
MTFVTSVEVSLAQFILETSAMDYSTTIYTPSVQAYSALTLATSLLRNEKGTLDLNLGEISPGHYDDIIQCIRALAKVLTVSKNWTLSAVRNKYGTPSFHMVA